MQVMCREINKGYETFVSLSFEIESYLISSQNVCFRRIKLNNSKQWFVFSCATYVLKKLIQQLATEKRAITFET